MGPVSSVFLATRLPLADAEAVAVFIMLVPVEEFISIKRTILTLWTGSESIFIPNLSILDALFNIGADSIKELLSSNVESKK